MSLRLFANLWRPEPVPPGFAKGDAGIPEEKASYVNYMLLHASLFRVEVHCPMIQATVTSCVSLAYTNPMGGIHAPTPG